MPTSTQTWAVEAPAARRRVAEVRQHAPENDSTSTSAPARPPPRTRPGRRVRADPTGPAACAARTRRTGPGEPRSPSGRAAGSTVVTWAPHSASRWVHSGPAHIVVRSSTVHVGRRATRRRDAGDVESAAGPTPGRRRRYGVTGSRQTWARSASSLGVGRRRLGERARSYRRLVLGRARRRGPTPRPAPVDRDRAAFAHHRRPAAAQVREHGVRVDRRASPVSAVASLGRRRRQVERPAPPCPRGMPASSEPGSSELTARTVRGAPAS